MAVASQKSDLHGHGAAIRKELGKRIATDRKLRALDVGTGFGINVTFLLRHLMKGSEVWTVDPSKEVLDKIKDDLGEKGAKVGFLNASADDMEFEDEYFDVVASVMVIHHVERLQPALEEMMRVLRPGGALLMVDYAPVASKELDFSTRHDAEDFASPSDLVEGLEKLGAPAKVIDKRIWYLVEAKKPSGRRPRALGRPSRARRER
jgi:ubiquinone/menaquinone biosynthesis C-methylase UbiE